MKMIEFTTIQKAIDCAKMYGGWIFYCENHAIWYDAAHYTMSTILESTPETGTIGTYQYIEEQLLSLV